jgi:uncharacterized membrane-anchored protein
MTGGDGDGAEGLRMVQAAGPGQHPATATNPEMPLNVLLADHPDAASLVDIGALGGNAPDDRQIPEERNCWC